MPLVTSKDMLLDAQKGNYAVGAFNVENMEMVMAVVEAAQEMQSPVILQTTPSTARYAGLNLYYANVKAVAERATVPVALHLDHGSSFELAVQALREGYTSVMIDGSHLPWEENSRLVRRVVDACRPCRVPVEAELGCIGGKEDDVDSGGTGLTSPEQAVKFVEQTGIDFLAVAIGTAHGVYKRSPNIRLDLLKEIKKRVFIPLVLHGTSGLEDEVVRSCIQEGICKVNYATDLRIAFTDGMRRILSGDKSVIDPKIYGNMGKELVKRYVQDKIWVCKSSGRGF
ncbi:class II fructose-bisphosphate aldolase [Clostridium boliviensis]|uniref:Class II fructose-bisphosphate aldolase n=1 Tax=Clostridium boliviensis TaxID=318465 RepID=A0ABU4GJD9_9CLOT|nr:class II fructose-bisphosphate aldolase [Clostridium boliviensis]MDW2797735.1 class II fructose-bisphosphate aldolase [Clostridium boliviensis]